MRTTMTLDDGVARDLIRITKAKNLVRALRTAAHDYLRMRRKEKLLGLIGNVDLKVDIKELRSRERPHDRR